MAASLLLEGGAQLFPVVSEFVYIDIIADLGSHPAMNGFYRSDYSCEAVKI